MAMHGIVYATNPRRGMIAIQTDGYGFTIIEDDVSNFELGDEVRWENDTGLGGEDYYNVTQDHTYHVFVQNHYVPPHLLRKQLLLEN